MVSQSRYKRPPVRDPNHTPRWIWVLLGLVAVLAIVLVIIAELGGLRPASDGGLEQPNQFAAPR